MVHVVVFAKSAGGRFVRRCISAEGIKRFESMYSAVAVGCAGACPCGGEGEIK